MIKVSVIIPVYKVSAFISCNARSLLSQTLQEVEYIFVDDATPDDSIDILYDNLENFPSRKDSVKVIRHKENKGLPAARNTGLALAQGEYVYHCDSDDWVEPEMLEKMYDAAKAADADIVYCDFFLSFEKKERYMSNPRYETAEDLLKKGLLGGTMKYNVWNKLVRRSLYVENEIVFPEGHSMGEDMTMIQLAAVADKVAYVPHAFYHYVKLNEGAYSNSYTQKKLDDIRYNVDRTVAFLQKKFGDSLDYEISLFKLSIKLPFLLTGDKYLYNLWREWYPEADKYACSNKEQPVRTRLSQWMASKGQWWYINLYYRVVYKFIYGFIFR